MHIAPSFVLAISCRKLQKVTLKYITDSSFVYKIVEESVQKRFRERERKKRLVAWYLNWKSYSIS